MTLKSGGLHVADAPSQPTDPHDRRAAKLVAELRAALGDAAFGEAWEEGQAMTFNEAMTCARSLMDSDPPGT
jgi:hypothetical protein